MNVNGFPDCCGVLTFSGFGIDEEAELLKQLQAKIENPSHPHFMTAGVPYIALAAVAPTAGGDRARKALKAAGGKVIYEYEAPKSREGGSKATKGTRFVEIWSVPLKNFVSDKMHGE